MVQQVRRAASLHVQAPVPSYFLCPISMDLMRDPVTLSCSGHTFDRPSIEAWLQQGHATCPSTRLPLLLDPSGDEELIPNHALRRMIQAWCVQHKSLGVERISTPRVPASAADVRLLVQELGSKTSDSLDLLLRLNRIALDQPRSRKHMLHSGALSHLPPLLLDSHCSTFSCSTPRGLTGTKHQEALRLLSSLLDVDEAGSCAAAPFWHPSDDEIASVARFVAQKNGLRQSAAGDAKAQSAAIILGRTTLSEASKKRIAILDGFMGGLVELIRDGAQGGSGDSRAVSAALKVMCEVCGCSTRSRVLAVEAGAVEALAQRVRAGGEVEVNLKALAVLCQCAEGRAAVAGDRQTMRTVVNAMGGVSETGSQEAARVVWQVLKWAPAGSPAEMEALDSGAFVKAVALVQCTASAQTRHICARIAKALSYAMPATALSSFHL